MKRIKHYFSQEGKVIKNIFFDIINLYKNFIYWTLARFAITLWSIVFGIIGALPFFMLSIIVAFLGPIDWYSIAMFILQGQDVSFEFLSILSQNYFWVFPMFFSLLGGVVSFFIFGSYSIYLHTHTVGDIMRGKVGTKIAKCKLLYGVVLILFFPLGWIKLAIMYLVMRKKFWGFWMKENEVFFDMQRIRIHLHIALLYVGVFLFLCFIYLLFAAGVYMLYNLGFIALSSFSLIAFIFAGIMGLIVLYALFRMSFSVVLLCEERKRKNLPSGLSYIKKSIQKTKGKILYFLPVVIIYFIFLSPFQLTQQYYEGQVEEMQDAVSYKLTQDQYSQEGQNYFEYIYAPYIDTANEDIILSIQKNMRFLMLLGILGYFVFTGLFMAVISSFYRNTLKI